MSITAADFFVLKHGPNDPPWDPPTREEIDSERLDALIAGPNAEYSDLDAAIALMDLVRDDLQLSGTSGGERLTDDDMRRAVRALERTSDRAGQKFKLPFRDHTAWRSYWIRNDASGSWQARRDLLRDLFEESYAVMLAAQDRAIASTLADPVSPHPRLGWPGIDAEIEELHRHFREARTPQDYRGLGNDCVHITEALSREVYNHAEHTPEGEEEPPAAKTKVRLDRYIDARLPGRENAELRKYARSTIELAQAVKHSGTPSRTEAGILADAIIALANMLRRLDET